ncbi:MAG: hydrolase, partial [Bacteroidota bacterium]
CDQVIGMHYDTFGYIVIDHEATINLFAEKGKQLSLIEIGGSLEF